MVNRELCLIDLYGSLGLAFEVKPNRQQSVPTHSVDEDCIFGMSDESY